MGRGQQHPTSDAIKVMQNSLGAQYFIVPDGTDSCCGWVCCAGTGTQVKKDPNPAVPISNFMNEADLENFIAEINAALTATHTPIFPCFLSHMPGACYIMCCAIRRQKKLSSITEQMNSKLVERKVMWKMHTCAATAGPNDNCAVGTSVMFSLHSTDPQFTSQLVNPQQQMLLMQQQMALMQQQLMQQGGGQPMPGQYPSQIQMQQMPVHQQGQYISSGIEQQGQMPMPIATAPPAYNQVAPVQQFMNTGTVSSCYMTLTFVTLFFCTPLCIFYNFVLHTALFRLSSLILHLSTCLHL